MGDNSPSSREAGGEGGEDFYIARSGKRADLLVSPEGGLGSKGHRLKVVGSDMVAGTSSPGSITSKVAESDTAAGTSSSGSEIENREFKEKEIS